tara:strand:+ start:112 stop:957 length:846 start_codon:yes stop_codon:yes gene_type:complete
MALSTEEKVIAIREAMASPYKIPESSSMAPYIWSQHEIGWIFQKERWGEQFGVPDFPKILPVLTFKKKVELDVASRMVVPILKTWEQRERYRIGSSPEEKKTIDGLRMQLIKGLGEKEGFDSPGEFIQVCTNAARPLVGTETIYFALLHAWENFNNLLNLASLITDGWSVIEGTDRIDPTPILANIALHGRKLLEIEHKNLERYMSDSFIPDVNIWNENMSQITYRYIASLILLGLSGGAREELDELESHLRNNEHRTKLERAVRNGNARLGELRVIFVEH